MGSSELFRTSLASPEAEGPKAARCERLQNIVEAYFPGEASALTGARARAAGLRSPKSSSTKLRPSRPERFRLLKVQTQKAARNFTPRF
jgi:hypothetical protein